VLDVEPFTLEEIERIAAELSPLHGALVVFVAETGLRPSEWIALERRDIDLGRRMVSVERAVVDREARPCKTRVAPSGTALRASRRGAPRRAAQAGHEHRISRFRERPDPSRQLAQPPLGTGARRRGHRRCGPYRLRHTAATNWLAAGLSLWEVAQYLGTSVRMIERTYGHLKQRNDEHVRQRLDAWNLRVQTRFRTPDPKRTPTRTPQTLMSKGFARDGAYGIRTRDLRLAKPRERENG
jgi:integrase